MSCLEYDGYNRCKHCGLSEFEIEMVTEDCCIGCYEAAKDDYESERKND